MIMGVKTNKSKQNAAHKDYKTLSKDDLRQELRNRGVKTSGKKTDLVSQVIYKCYHKLRIS